MAGAMEMVGGMFTRRLVATAEWPHSRHKRTAKRP
jgi:hypothetical protein